MMRDTTVKTYSKAKRIDYIPEDEIDEILPTPEKNRLIAVARGLQRQEQSKRIKKDDDSPASSKSSIMEPLNISSASEDEDDDDLAKLSAEIRNALDSLEPGRMLNDTVIDLYMNYLLGKSDDRFKPHIHLFNTFLFKKLKTLVKNSNSDKTTQRLRWDKNVDLFDKYFLVIPVCDHSHWLLLVVCFPGHRPGCTIEPPCMLVFDSLGFNYLPRLFEPVRRFLQQRWDTDRAGKGKRNFLDEQAFKLHYVKVCHQRNAYDCGVHLLHNFETFITWPMRTVRNALIKQSMNEFDCDSQIKRVIIKRRLRELVLKVPSPQKKGSPV